MKTHVAQSVQNLPAVYTVEAFASAASRHPESIRRAIRRGDIAAIKFGPSWRIPADVANRILTGGLSLHRG